MQLCISSAISLGSDNIKTANANFYVSLKLTSAVIIGMPNLGNG